MNIYEQWVYDAFERNGFAVFVPYKDRGVDCLITGRDFGGVPLRIQIKGSRSYGDGGGWWVINAAKLQQAQYISDRWIFVWTRVVKKGQFHPRFLLITPDQRS